jgi:hypothetical protein
MFDPLLALIPPVFQSPDFCVVFSCTCWDFRGGSASIMRVFFPSLSFAAYHASEHSLQKIKASLALKRSSKPISGTSTIAQKTQRETTSFIELLFGIRTFHSTSIHSFISGSSLGF